MGRKKLTTDRNINLPLLCSICGDKARGYNFSVLSCVSCKTFFRRRGLLNPKNLRCRYRRNCVITKETRGNCLSCRLKKSLELGMDPLMIRCPFNPQRNFTKIQEQTMRIENQIQLPTPRSLNLLRNDCSNLTSDQWNLLSNIIHSYDEQNVINRVKHSLQEMSSLPPKLRVKPADILNLTSQTLLSIQPLIEHSPHFQDLSSHARRALILHNIYYTGSFNACFVAREIDSFNNVAATIALSTMFGSDYIRKCAQDNERLERNGNLVKLMLCVLIFSSNYSIVEINNEEDVKTIPSSIELIHVQNIYVAMLWKYLVYLYGYDGATIHFSSMVKSVVDMLGRVEQLLNNITHDTLVDNIVTETERSLFITD